MDRIALPILFITMISAPVLTACDSDDDDDMADSNAADASVYSDDSRYSGDPQNSLATSAPDEFLNSGGDSSVFYEAMDAGVEIQSEDSGDSEGENADIVSMEDDAGVTDDPDQDTFKPPKTNPFVMTEFDPFSTFAADVDTASYDIFRRDINHHQLPQPGSVRLEEYVNYFVYDYPSPAADAEYPFSISLAAAPSIFNSQTTLLRVGIQAKEAQAYDKKPANVVFLIDVSGSMSSADKLPLVQFLLKKTLDVLDVDDTVSIVTYASDTGVRLTPTKVTDRENIVSVIDRLTAGGSTAGASGIELAYQQASAGFIEDGINHVIICTDGDFNVGPSSNEELVTLIEEKRKSGITLTALGFGTGNLNDSMMEEVSNAGNGIYAVISDHDQAESYVEDRMLQTLIHVAKDMKIQVEFNPEKVLAYRLLGYENRAIADQLFRDDAVDAGEVGTGHRVTALYELVMSGEEVPKVPDAPDPEDGDPVIGEREINIEDMVLVKVRYKQVAATEQDPAFEVSATLQPADIEDDYQEADLDFGWALAIASFAEILKGSPYADANRLDAIEEIVSKQKLRDKDREEFAQLFSVAKSLL